MTKDLKRHAGTEMKARAAWKGGAKDAANPAYAKLAETFKTEPDFYFGTCAKDCRIEAIILLSARRGGPTRSLER